MYCRYCGAQVKEGALFCQNCGRAIVWQTQTAGAGASADSVAGASTMGGSANEGYYYDTTIHSKAHENNQALVWRSLTKVMVFSLLTFGIYGLYMIYQISKQVAPYESRNRFSPLVQTVLCAILPVYFWYWSFIKARELSRVLQKTTGETGDFAILALLFSIASFGTGAIIILQLMINKILLDPEATVDNASKSILIAIVIQIAILIPIFIIL